MSINVNVLANLLACMSNVMGGAALFAGSNNMWSVSREAIYSVFTCVMLGYPIDGIRCCTMSMRLMATKFISMSYATSH